MSIYKTSENTILLEEVKELRLQSNWVEEKGVYANKPKVQVALETLGVGPKGYTIFVHSTMEIIINQIKILIQPKSQFKLMWL